MSFRSIQHPLSCLFFIILTNLFSASQAQQYGVTFNQTDKNLKIIMLANSGSHTLTVTCDAQGNFTHLPTSDVFTIKPTQPHELDISFKDGENNLHAKLTKNKLAVDKLNFADDLNLKVDSHLSFNGDLSCDGNLHIDAKEFCQEGTLTCSNDLEVDAIIKLEQKGNLVCKKAKIRAASCTINKGKFFINGDLDLQASYCMFDSTVHVKGNAFVCASKFLNRGDFLVRRNLTFICNKEIFDRKHYYRDNQFINNYETGRIDAFGKLTINFPTGQIRNYSGKISAMGDIMIIADRLEMINHGIDRSYGSYHQADNSGCTTYQENVVSGFGFMVSRTGDIFLDLKTGKNLASVIQAAKNLRIRARSFSNLSLLLQQTRCKPYVKHDGYALRVFERTSQEVESVHSFKYIPAILTAQNGVEIIINNLSFLIKDPQSHYMFPGFENTGRVGSTEYVYVMSDDGFGSWFNGHRIVNTALAIKPSVVPDIFIPLSSQTIFSYKNSDFVNVHPFFKKETALISRTLMLHTGDKLPRGNEQFEQSFMMLAEEVMQALLVATNSPYIDELRGLTQNELLEALYKKGVDYGVSMGKLQPVASYSNNEGALFPLEYTSHALQKYADKDSIFTGRSLANTYHALCKLELLKRGSHFITLKENYIKKSPVSMLYVTPDICENNKPCLKTKLHVSNADFVANAAAEGITQTKKIIANNLRSFKNTGKIVALDTIEIQAKTIQNSKLSYENKVLAGDNITREYTIRIPQPGGEIHGLTITLTAEGDAGNDKGGIENKGGTIAAQKKVTLYSKNGDTVNEPLIVDEVVRWDLEDVAKARNFDDSSQKVTFKSGVISSREDSVALISEVGHVVNRASALLAKEDVELNGYLGVLSETLISTYVKFSGSLHHDKKALNWNDIETEAAEIGRAYIESRRKNVKSENGKHEDIGSYTNAEEETSQTKYGDVRTAAKAKIRSKCHTFGFNVLGYASSDVSRKEDFVVEVIPAKKVDVITEGSVFFQGVFLHDGMIINITAGKDVTIKPEMVETEETVDEFTLGVNFPGSEFLKNLTEGEFKKLPGVLLDSDPLTAALKRMFSEADAADKTADGMHLLMQTFKDLYGATSNKPDRGYLRDIGQRFGITDQNGSFSPDLSLRLGFRNTQSKSQQAHNHGAPNANLKEINIKSGGDVEFQQSFNAESATIDAEKVTFGSAQEYFEEESVEGGISVSGGMQGIGSVGVDYNQNRRTSSGGSHGSYNFGSSVLNAKNVHIVDSQVQGNFKGAIGNFTVESTTQTTTSNHIGGRLNVGTNSGSGSFSKVSELQKQVEFIAGFSGTFDGEIDELNLHGALIDADELKVNTINSADIEEVDKKTGGSFGVGFSPSSGGSGILGTIDAEMHNRNNRGKVKATISDTTKVRTDDLEGLRRVNRNKDTMRFTLKKGGHYRVVLPIVNPNEFMDALKQIKNAFMGGGSVKEAIDKAGGEKVSESSHEGESEASGSDGKSGDKQDEPPANEHVPSDDEPDVQSDDYAENNGPKSADEFPQDEFEFSQTDNESEEQVQSDGPDTEEHLPHYTLTVEENITVETPSGYAQTGNEYSNSEEISGAIVGKDIFQNDILIETQIKYVEDQIPSGDLQVRQVMFNGDNAEIVISNDDESKKVRCVIPSCSIENLIAIEDRQYIKDLFERNAVLIDLTSKIFYKVVGFAKDVAIFGLDVGLDLVPIVGTAKNSYEAYSGRSLLTNDELGAVSRSFNGISAAVPFVSGIVKIVKLTKHGMTLGKAVIKVASAPVKGLAEIAGTGYKALFKSSGKEAMHSAAENFAENAAKNGGKNLEKKLAGEFAESLSENIAKKVEREVTESVVENLIENISNRVIVTIDKRKLYDKYFKHIWSEKHVQAGIESLAPKSEIFDKLMHIVEKADLHGVIKNSGWTRFKTIINGHQAEIRVFVEKGQLMSVNAFKGISNTASKVKLTDFTQIMF